MQEEKITWVDVKNGMPNKSGWYLVTTFDSVTESYWNKQQKKWLVRESDLELHSVVAWADMPKPFKR